MTEIFINAKNTFIDTRQRNKLVHRRSFSDSNLCMENDWETTPIYSIREENGFLTPPFDAGVSIDPTLQSLDHLNSSELVIDSFITGSRLQVSTCDGKLPRTLRQTTLTTNLSFSSLGPFDEEPTCSSPRNTYSTPNPTSTRSPSFNTRNTESQSPSCSDAIVKASRRGSDRSDDTSPGSEGSSQPRPKEWIPINDIAAANPVQQSEKTTVMLRNIPCRYSQDELLEEMKQLNLPVNFLYLPPARHSPGNLGYSFINFEHAKDAETFINAWEGHVWYFQPKSKKRGSPCYATLQGFKANVDYYSGMKVSRRKSRPYINHRAYINGSFCDENKECHL
jgi:hypothetical protein